MRASDVGEILAALEAAGVGVWLDGGWGVDALVGEETRAHDDLDLAVAAPDCERAAAALAPLGFGHDPHAEPGLPARLVLRDGDGRQVDFHPLAFDGDGNGWQRLGERTWGLYPASDLDAEGRVGGRTVRCISAELQLRFHLGWEWDDRALHDVRLLADRFGLPLPPAARLGT